MSSSFHFNMTTSAPHSDNSSLHPILYDQLILFPNKTRYIFMAVFLVVSIPSLIGNCAVIRSIRRRNYRFIQKSCIISLALSDILCTIAIAFINVSKFVEPALVWFLGAFLCQFLPMCQLVGILSSSMALTFIAMDRYRNVVHAVSKRWNPRPVSCITVTLVVWIVNFTVSYPVYTHFIQIPIPLVMNGSRKIVVKQLCMALEDKLYLRNYYIVMVLIIFLPLLIIFIWFYQKIASLVWRHRKPLSVIFNNKETSGETTSTSDARNCNPKSQKDVRVGRKIRTCKIIITLMIVFIVCRLPYFTFYILKFSLSSSDADHDFMWYLNYSFIALQVISCCLNPLLYTFLNVTLQICVKTMRSIREFIWEICCFCFSNAVFEDSEMDNPFTVDNANEEKNISNKTYKVKFDDEVKY